jgi:hypothetical protein
MIGLFRSPPKLAALAQVSAPVVITPASFPGLVAWWKADSFSLADGTAIGGAGKAWIDQSGNNNHATQASGTLQPVFKTNVVNGKPIIRFDGVNDLLTMTSQILLQPIGTAHDFTVIFVGSVNGDSMILGQGGNNIQFRKGRSGNNGISKYFGALDQSSSIFLSASNAVVMCTWLNSATLNGTFRENKTAQGTWSEGALFLDTIIDQIGATSFGGFASGDFAEICVYTSMLSTVDCDSLYDNYFKPRWGLP